jgi:hypothetical protein
MLRIFSLYRSTFSMQNSVYFKNFINIKKMNVSTNNIKQKSNMLIDYRKQLGCSASMWFVIFVVLPVIKVIENNILDTSLYMYDSWFHFNKIQLNNRPWTFLITFNYWHIFSSTICIQQTTCPSWTYSPIHPSFSKTQSISRHLI